MRPSRHTKKRRGVNKKNTTRRRRKAPGRVYDPRTLSHVDYILSCHAKEFPSGPWTNPDTLSLILYVPRGSTFSCPARRPNEICSDPFSAIEKAAEIVSPGATLDYDSYLLPDNPEKYAAETRSFAKKWKFKSGVKDCFTNQIILNIDTDYPDGLWFSEVVGAISSYHTSTYGPEYPANLHCLYCRTSADSDTDLREPVYPMPYPPEGEGAENNYWANPLIDGYNENTYWAENQRRYEMGEHNKNAYTGRKGQNYSSPLSSNDESI